MGGLMSSISTNVAGEGGKSPASCARYAPLGGGSDRNLHRAAMTRTSRRHDDRSSRRQHPAVLALLALLIGGGLLAGCGSSKPPYCSPVSKVENAVKSLPTLDDVKKNGVGTLKSALVQLQQNATAAIDQAKTDFSGQTTALKTSVDALSSTVKQVVGTPSLQTLTQLAAELSAVSAAAKNLQTAVSSKCG
jgi:hypothetical protein